MRAVSERAVLVRWLVWLCLVPPLLLSGCLAQKADVKQLERTFDRKVSDLGKREQDLEQKITQAEQSIEQQRKKAEQLFREARARFQQDIKELREESISKIHGQLEKADHDVKKNRAYVDNLTHRIETLTQLVLKQQGETQKRLATTEQAQKEQEAKLTQAEQSLRADLKKTLEHVQALSPALQSLATKMDSRLVEQDKAIAANRGQTATLAEQLESETRVLTYQIRTFRRTLPQFKQALADLGKELLKGDTKLAKDISKQTQALSAKIDRDIHELSAYLTEATQKIDADIKATAAHLGEVTQKVDTVGTATTEHLDKVNKSVASVADALKTMSAEMAARVDAQASRAEEMGTRVAEVSDSIASVAEALKTMSAEMAARVDAQASRAEEMGTRVAEVNDSVASVAEALKTMSADVVVRADAQEIRLDEAAKRVAEVNDSVVSVAEALKTMSDAVMGRVDAQEIRLEETTNSLREVTAEVNSLIQTVTQLNATSGTESGGRQSGASISKSSAPTAASRETVASATISKGDVADENSERSETYARERYEAILATFKEGDLDGAQQGFREFLMKYPTASRAPNAQYWLGECYYGEKQYKRAIEAYHGVETKYPNSSKIPAALLKKGYAYLALKNGKEGLAMLERVVRSYPGSPEAAKASDRLRRLKSLR